MLAPLAKTPTKEILEAVYLGAGPWIPKTPAGAMVRGGGTGGIRIRCG